MKTLHGLRLSREQLRKWFLKKNTVNKIKVQKMISSHTMFFLWVHLKLDSRVLFTSQIDAYACWCISRVIDTCSYLKCLSTAAVSLSHTIILVLECGKTQRSVWQSKWFISVEVYTISSYCRNWYTVTCLIYFQYHKTNRFWNVIKSADAIFLCDSSFWHVCKNKNHEILLIRLARKRICCKNIWTVVLLMAGYWRQSKSSHHARFWWTKW